MFLGVIYLAMKSATSTDNDGVVVPIMPVDHNPGLPITSVPTVKPLAALPTRVGTIRTVEAVRGCKNVRLAT